MPSLLNLKFLTLKTNSDDNLQLITDLGEKGGTTTVLRCRVTVLRCRKRADLPYYDAELPYYDAELS
ncbi:MAG TPA: hypothetical protein VGZ69_02010 [Candidatus Rhabdochlamydia sp.]|nr:hypothetical protein [Candidatus Rhabdochlamydia sp.]